METLNQIVSDAYYLIKLYNDDKKEVIPLHINILMYLFEAYYMNVKNTDKLYACDYEAWDLSPVAIPLYEKFKKYGSDNILLNEDEQKIADGICFEKKNLLGKIYEAFGGFSAMDLVNFVRADNTPWKLAFDKGERSIIDKQELKKWSSKYVKKA